MKIRGICAIGLYLLCDLLVVIFLGGVIFSYSYFDFYILAYFFAVFIIVNMMINNALNSGRIISVFLTFNAFGLLYTSFYIIQNIFLNEQIPQNKCYAMLLSLISIIAFNFAFYITKKRDFVLEKSLSSWGNRYSNRIGYLLLAVLVISVITEYYSLFVKINFSSYLIATRAEKSLLTTGNELLSFYVFTIPLVCIVSLQNYLKYKDRLSVLLFIPAVIISLINSIISMSRAELISILLPIIFLCEYYKKISKTNILILIVGALTLFGFWKSLFSDGDSFIYYDSEFNTWYEICDNILSTNYEFLYGKTYLETALNMIVPFTNTEPLSIWYVKTFEYNTWISGGGRGFSAVLEAFLNFGVLGNVIIYSFYGALLKHLEFNLEKDNDKMLIIYMIILVSMYQFFRSESYSLWKNMVWFRIYPFLILMWISRKFRFNIIRLQGGNGFGKK